MHIWKIVVLFLIFIGCAVMGCSQETLKTSPENLLGRWQMVKAIQSGNEVDKPNPYLRRYEVEIEFLPDGKLTGTSSANPMVGQYETQSSNFISIHCGYESKVGENAWGDLFADTIENVDTYKIKNNMLFLSHMDNQLIFQKIK
ncbi:META domain-containing protein [Salmonirosea aquatica]